MRIVIVAAGTWGDVRPNVVLGQALQRAGYEVLLMASEEFRVWIQQHNLAFSAINVNVQQLLDSFSSSTNLRSTLQTIRALAPATLQMGKDISAALRKDDVLLINETGLGLINGVVEKYQLRVILINFQPFTPTREFPTMLPKLPAWMPAQRTYNRSAGWFIRRTNWSMMGGHGNKIRREQFGLPKQTWHKHRQMLAAIPSLLLVSRQVIPPPADWQPTQRVIGYLFDEDNHWEAPADLLNFLDNGNLPIYIGFGSMRDKNPEVLTTLIVEAVKRTGKRAILLSGWAGIGSMALPDQVLPLKYAPHHWLFPRMAAVVHHGGCGTTGAAIAAGVPAVVVPIIADQPFWARRVHELGVGTAPIPRNKLTVDKLAAAIMEATSDQAMQDKARVLGTQIAAEDGVGEAVKTVQEFLA